MAGPGLSNPDSRRSAFIKLDKSNDDSSIRSGTEAGLGQVSNVLILLVIAS